MEQPPEEAPWCCRWWCVYVGRDDVLLVFYLVELLHSVISQRSHTIRS